MSAIARFFPYLVLCGLTAIPSAACSSDIDTCEARRACPDSAESPVSLESGGAGSSPSGGSGSHETGPGGGESSDRGGAGDGGGGKSSDRSGPRAGSGGDADRAEARTGGEAGASSNAECNEHSDCDDLDPCNGLEACIDDACVPGDPPCENPDTTHCDVSCEVLGPTSTTCTVIGKDKDGDGYKNPACEADPGNDCDDDDDNVHPGANEICDLKDNDCDEKVDFEDGLTLSGSTTNLTSGARDATSPELAWSPTRNAYAVMWIDASGPLKVSFVDQTNAVVGEEVISSATSEPVVAARMVYGHDRLAFTWLYGTGPAQESLYGRFETIDHASSGAMDIPSQWEPGIGVVDSGWGIVATGSSEFVTTTYTTRSFSETGGATQAFLNAVGVGNTVGWLEVGASISWGRATYSPSGTLSTTSKLLSADSGVGATPGIGTNGSEWAFVYQKANDDGVFAIHDLDGSQRCSTGFDVPAGQVFRVVHVGALYLVTGTKGNSQALLMRFDSDCKAVGGTAKLGTAATMLKAPMNVAASPHGIALAWGETKSGSGDYAKLRLTGPNLCD
jgi:hypothetical protein